MTPAHSTEDNDEELRFEMTLLGYAVYVSQKIEFSLYGIVAHIDPTIRTDKRFRELTGESFLWGDISALKATFGQLVKVSGDLVFIASDDLDRFVNDRNLLVHNYFRHFYTALSSSARSSAPIDFLKGFIDRGHAFLAILEGLLVCMREATAQKAGRLDELNFTETDLVKKQAYLEYVAARKVL